MAILSTALPPKSVFLSFPANCAANGTETSGVGGEDTSLWRAKQVAVHPLLKKPLISSSSAIIKLFRLHLQRKSSIFYNAPNVLSQNPFLPVDIYFHLLS